MANGCPWFREGPLRSPFASLSSQSGLKYVCPPKAVLARFDARVARLETRSGSSCSANGVGVDQRLAVIPPVSIKPIRNDLNLLPADNGWSRSDGLDRHGGSSTLEPSVQVTLVFRHIRLEAQWATSPRDAAGANGTSPKGPALSRIPLDGTTTLTGGRTNDFGRGSCAPVCPSKRRNPTFPG